MNLMTLKQFVARVRNEDDAADLDEFLAQTERMQRDEPWIFLSLRTLASWRRELEAWRALRPLWRHIHEHPEAVQPSPMPGMVDVKITDEVLAGGRRISFPRSGARLVFEFDRTFNRAICDGAARCPRDICFDAENF
jgi:hypothetical protein